MTSTFKSQELDLLQQTTDEVCYQIQFTQHVVKIAIPIVKLVDLPQTNPVIFTPNLAMVTLAKEAAGNKKNAFCYKINSKC